jgi:hypothetical protein
MNEQKQGDRTSIISIPVLLLISALAGTLFLGPSPLIPSRPEGTKRNMTGTLGTQDVEARLWQDPFEALELAGVTDTERKEDLDVVVTGPSKLTWKATASGVDDHEIEQLAGQIELRYRKGNPEATGYPKPEIALDKKIQVILAMVSGGPYPEDVESRIRSRVAVMAALGTAGYRSEDEEQIGYVRSNWPIQLIPDNWGSLTADGWSKLVLPYEWFTRRIHHADSLKPDAPKSNHVLVLWLRDDMFADEPLYRLNELVGYLLDNNRIDQEKVKISILGPHTSTTLRAFFSLDEWNHPAANDKALARTMCHQAFGCSDDCLTNNWLTNTKIFSPAATTMQGLLVPSGEKRTGTESQIQRRLKTLDVDFYNAICTDDDLASTLLAELARRGVDLENKSNHIALVNEWDTFYGRMIPLTFRYELEQFCGDPRPDLLQQLRFNLGYHSGQLHLFSYLQGIDGKLPASSSQGLSQPNTNSENAKDKERKTPEANRAEGPSQLDYIPRLADHIEQENQKLFMESAWPRKSKIRAIGILGSDLYDKLLALQALRPRFPDAIFFTTDLDARLWHPSQLKWTRNIIVASSFGLELQPKLQKDIPPFRDSYQTAEYLACLAGLGIVSPDTFKQISPRLFEIGRNGAVDISTPSKLLPHEQVRLNFEQAFSREWGILQNPPEDDPLYPQPRMRWSWNWAIRVAVLLAISVVLALFLLARVSPLLRRFITGRNQALRREIFIKSEDIRDEAKLFTSLREWFPASPWGPLLSEKFKMALGVSAPQGSPIPSPDLMQRARVTIIDGLNKLIEKKDLPPIHAQKQQSATEPQVKKGWLRRMIRNRKTIEEAAPDALFSFKPPFDLASRSLSNFARFSWVAPAGMLLLLLVALMDNQASGQGEPFSWADGVSAWPTQFIRLLTATLAIAFILRGEEDLRRNQLELSRRFMLPEDKADKGPRSEYIVDWLHLGVGVKAKNLWLEYRWLGHRAERAWRIFFVSALYFGSWFFLAASFDQLVQPMPIRGVICRGVSLFMLIVAIITTTLLNFFVVDATRLCSRFVHNLSQGPTIYPQATLRKFCGGIEPAADDDLEEWLDMHIIAARSAEVSKLIYYPFITLALVIAARARYWDDWQWQPLLILAFLLNAAWAVSSAIVLQRSARRAKARALESIRQKLCRPSEVSEPRIKRFKKIQEDISAMNSGAFAGYLNNPILGALSLPVAGGVVAFVIEFLTNS